MLLVCVRRGVQRDRELTGDVGAVEVGPEQPQHVQLALAQGLDEALSGGSAGVAAGAQEPADVVPRGALFRDPSQQRRHRRSLTGEHADVPLRLGQGQRPLQRRHRARDVGAGVVGERLQHQDLDDAARPLPRFGRLAKALQEPGRIIDGSLRALRPVLGQQRPGQGDVLELAQIGEIGLSRQALRTRPGQGLAHPALRGQHARPQRRDRPHVRGEVTRVHALGLVEQVEGAVQISLGVPDSRHRDPPAIRVLRQPGVLAQLLGAQQVPGGGRQVVALASDLAHPHVHVRRSPQHRPVLVGGESQRLLVGAQRLTQATLRDADVRQRDRAAEDVGDVPGPPQPLGAGGVGLVRGLEVAATPECEPHEGRCPGSGEVVLFGGALIARWARSMVAGPSPPIRARPARYISIAPGRRASSPSSRTTIPSGGAHVPEPSPVGSCHRSTSRSRSSTPSSSPTDISAPMKPAASTGLTRTTSSGMASSQPRMVASCLALRSSGIASWTSPAARSTSPAASAWRIAWDGSAFCSYHWLARRCRAATRSARSSRRWVSRTSANRWW